MAINFKLLQIFFCIFILNTAIEAAPAVTENTMAKVDLSNEGNLMNENLDGNQPLQEVPGDFKEEITESPERINERKIRSPEFDTIDRAGFDDLGYHYFKKPQESSVYKKKESIDSIIQYFVHRYFVHKYSPKI